jgi:hypothetical protein
MATDATNPKERLQLTAGTPPPPDAAPPFAVVPPSEVPPPSEGAGRSESPTPPAFQRRLRKLNAHFQIWRRRRMHRFCGATFALSLSTLGVVLSIYGSILTDVAVKDWWTLLMKDYNLETQELMLSRVMSPMPAVVDSSNQEAGDLLYVFILDVSGSMIKDRLEESERDAFYAKFDKNGLPIPEICRPTSRNVTRWLLARAEICAFLEHVPAGAFASLWTFAGSPKMAAEEVKFVKEDRRIARVEEFRAILEGPKFNPEKGEDLQNTDFEALLTRLHEVYIRAEKNDWREIHFFIVSDFEHDIGKKNAYDFSVERIAEKFSDIGKVGNTMFHLDVIGDPRHQVNSIVRVAESTVEWFQCRVHSVEGGQATGHDFFNTFDQSAEKLTFYYVGNTTRVVPVKLWANERSDHGAQVVLGLMRDLQQSDSANLAMQISTAWNEVECIAPRNPGLIRWTPFDESRRPEILRPGTNRLVKVERQNDYICLQPDSVSDNGAKYKLTIARVAGRQDRRTYTVDIEFRKVLPKFAALTILSSLGALIVSGVFILLWFVTYWRGLSRV